MHKFSNSMVTVKTIKNGGPRKDINSIKERISVNYTSLGEKLASHFNFKNNILGRLPVDVRTWISLNPTDLIALNFITI